MNPQTSEQAVMADHPYKPRSAHLPGYLPNDMPTVQILAYFVAVYGSIIVGTYQFTRRFRPNLSKVEVATTAWFVFSAFIHLGMEGYVVYNFRTIAGLQTVLGQAWKEYSHSDSRYLTQDSFVITMEAVTTVFWGPLCLIVAYCIFVDHPMRHPLQIIVSLGQIYGDVLYFATCMYQHVVFDIVYCRPEAFYFVAYFLFMNLIWIVIPGPLMVSSVREIAKAFVKVKELERGLKKNK